MKRSSQWDNAKVVLIFLVVLAHYLGTGMVYKPYQGGLWTLSTGIYSFIYLFHMPMFAFISGYFSKNTERARARAFSDLLLPYLVVNTIFVILDKEPVNPLLAPYGAMWYLLALFLWRMMAKDVGRLRYSWLWAMGFSIFASLFPPGKNYVAFTSAITFFPFFLLGLSTTPETVERCKKLPRWLCAGILACALCGAVLLVKRGFQYESIGFFSGMRSQELGSLKYIVADVFRYPVALILGICLFRLIPEKPLPITHIGKNTLTVMILHTVPRLRDAMDAINPFKGNPAFCLIYWTVLSLLVTGLFGSDLAAEGFRRFMALVRRLLPKKPAQPPVQKSE